jgi:hypothetical protein
MGCVSRIIHDGGGGHAAAPLPRRSHAGTMQRRAATVPPPCRGRAALRCEREEGEPSQFDVH